jgi:hypothetical protein
MVSLELRTMLPVIRKAYDDQSLQLFISEGPCTYAGPCAIGVCLDPDTRVSLDNHPTNTEIANLLMEGVVTAPEDQHQDLCLLQIEHDNGTAEDFGDLLTRLEAKYA